MVHANPRAHFEAKFDRDALRRAVRGDNDKLSDRELEQTIDRLLDLGALVEVDIAGDALESFLRNYILIPTAGSFGNSPTDPDLYAIGNDGEEQLSLDSWTRILWAGSHRDGSMWNGCVLLAAEYPNVTPEEVTKHLAEMLPAIVATECGYLERGARAVDLHQCRRAEAGRRRNRQAHGARCGPDGLGHEIPIG